MFERDAVEQALIADGIAVDPATLRGDWEHSVDSVLAEATLARPAAAGCRAAGAAAGIPSISGHLLATMQFLQRAYPGATW